MTMIKCYRHLIRLKTFEDRFEYLKLDGQVGKASFGFDRYINQIFYHSIEWSNTRNEILLRDNGCDLALEDREIYTQPTIHHINPITLYDIEHGHDCVFDPENLITTSARTHRAIHYGGLNQVALDPIQRRKGDTIPWKVY